MPADAQAAPKVSVPVIYKEHQGKNWIIFKGTKIVRDL